MSNIENFISASSNYLIKGATSEYVISLAKNIANPIALTLTFKQSKLTPNKTLEKLNREIASKEVRKLYNRLNKKYFKNKYHRKRKGQSESRFRLEYISCVELDNNERIHYHIIIGRPNFITFKEFEIDIKSNWRSLDWADYQVDVSDGYTEAWAQYITKNCNSNNLKGEFDPLNTNINSHSAKSHMNDKIDKHKKKTLSKISQAGLIEQKKKFKNSSISFVKTEIH
ncbi:MAG: hypothetical protein J0L55_00955 [Caulobacterales bacterium]|nr:hypothetical protein [Caulobacterales bacterium]MCA0373728.1 hypothetical protein [Pseudomonadota bacterium]